MCLSTDKQCPQKEEHDTGWTGLTKEPSSARQVWHLVWLRNREMPWGCSSGRKAREQAAMASWDEFWHFTTAPRINRHVLDLGRGRTRDPGFEIRSSACCSGALLSGKAVIIAVICGCAGAVSFPGLVSHGSSCTSLGRSLIQAPPPHSPYCGWDWNKIQMAAMALRCSSSQDSPAGSNQIFQIPQFELPSGCSSATSAVIRTTCFSTYPSPLPSCPSIGTSIHSPDIPSAWEQ